MKQVVLVTGGCGFVGSHLIDLLYQKTELDIVNVDLLCRYGNPDNVSQYLDDDRYTFYQADICDSGKLSEIFKEHNPSYVVNLAVQSAPSREVDQGVYMHTNVQGTRTLLDVAQDAWQDRKDVMFLQASTEEVYGLLAEGEFFKEDTPVRPHSPFSTSKASADQLVQSYVKNWGIPAVITRSAINFGPRQYPDKIIPMLIRSAADARPIPIYGDGSNTQDWTYVLDHCEALLAVLLRGEPGQVYNISGRNVLTHLEIAKGVIAHIRAILGEGHCDGEGISEELLQFTRDRREKERKRATDPSKLEQELGWRAAHSFDENLRATVEWYLSNLDWVERALSREPLSAAPK